MNKRFKRVMSSVLAFAMVCSSMIVMNVGSVYAADATVYDVATVKNASALSSTAGTVLQFETGVDSPFTWKQKGALTAPYGSLVYYEDGSAASFTQALLPSGGSTSNGYTIALTGGQTLGVYYTTTDSAFGTKDQSKSGYAILKDSTGTQVAADSNTANKAGKTAYLFEYTATADGTYTLLSSGNRLAVYAFTLTSGAAAETTTDTTITFEDESGATFSGTPVVKDSNGEVVSGTNNVYALYAQGEYTVEADGYVTTSFFADDSGAKTVTMTPVWEVYVVETNSVDFTLYDADDVALSTNIDGKYSLTYNATYTAKATNYGDYSFTVTANEMVNITLLESSEVTFSVKNADGTALTNYAVKDSEGSEISGTENVFVLIPNATYTISVADYVDYTFTYNSESELNVVMDSMYISTATAFDMKAVSTAVTATAGALAAGTEVKDGKLTYYVNAAAVSYSGAITIGDKEFTSANSAIQKFKTNSAPTSATSGGYGLFKLYLNAGSLVKIYAASGSTSARNFNFYDATGDTVTVTAGESNVGGAQYQEFTAANTGVYYIGASNEFRVWEIDVVPAVDVTVTGQVSITDGLTAPTQVIFTESVSGGTVTADVTNGSYSATLVAGKTYSVSCNDDTLMANTASSSITVSESTTTFDVGFMSASAETVTGTVYGLDDPTLATISFSQAGSVVASATFGTDGTYSVSLLPGTYNVAVTTIDGYTASSLSTTDLTVEQNGSENYKNVLYTAAVVGATSKDVYVGSNGGYTTIQDAVNAIAASSLSSSATDKFVVHIAPGTYEEQVIVSANNITFVTDSNGDLTDSEANAVISWYYGIDYGYYSVGADGYYSKAYAVDKHSSNTPQRWGAAVRVIGSNFLAEGVTFQNTFNKSVSTAELADGVTALGLQGNTSADRTAEGFDPKAKASTERAAAIALDGSNAELHNCKFIGSQDTVYTGSSNVYFNDCYISGQTDPIFGNTGNIVAFDNCELNWCGYSTGAAAGYMTATRGQYIFRDCTFTADSTAVSGYYGRPWGTTSNVSYINCTTNGTILAEGWASMSGVTPADATCREYGNTTDGSTAFASTLGTQYTADEAAALAAEKDAQFFGSWLPVSHVAYEATAETTYDWDFASASTVGTLQGSTLDLKSTDEAAIATLDATNGKIAYHSTSYGFNMSIGAQILFTLEGDGTFPTTVKVDSAYQNNTSVISVYNTTDMTTALATATAAGIQTITLDLGSVAAGEYAIVVSDASNFYTKGFTVVTEGTVMAPPVSTDVVITGAVTGLEADDTTPVVKFTNGATVISANVSNGTYTATVAKDTAYSVVVVGNGVYKADSITATEAGTQDIAATRIAFSLPNLNFKTADAATFFANVTFTSGTYTDPYSGVTYYNPNTGYASSHGLKATSNNLITFTASASGTVSVGFTATTNGGSDTVQLMVNGTLVGEPVAVVAGSAVTVSTTVVTGDVVTVYAPTASNLYYSNIDVSYASAEDYSLTWGGAQTMANQTSGTDVRLLGTVATEDVASIDSVGFAVATSYKAASDMKKLGVTTVFTSVVADSSTIAPSDLNADGKYIAAYAVTGMPNGNTLYVYTYYVVDGVTTYSDTCYTITIDDSGSVTVGTYTAE